MLFFLLFSVSAPKKSLSESEWKLTFDFMDLFNAKDLIVYYTVRSHI